MINLEKYEERKKEVKIALEKFDILEQKAKVMFFIDCSGSMAGAFFLGDVQDAFERILPLADLIDDDHSMDIYTFNNMCCHVGEGNVHNSDKVLKGIRPIGGTNYAPIIRAAMKKANTKLPTFVIVMTDGDCGDRGETERAIIEASRQNIFFKFVGIGQERFRFLEQLDDMKGRYVDNADFFKAERLNSLSDKELYNLLIQEYPTWLKAYKTPAAEPQSKGFFNKLFGAR